MKELLPGVFEFKTVAKEGDPSSPAVLVVRRNGNVLFANKFDLTDAVSAIKKKGKLAAIFVGDRHHVGENTLSLAKRLKTPLTSSEIEAKVVARKGFEIGNSLKYERQHVFEDVEAIPTPGHTTGAFSYLIQHNKKKLLFIGDTLVHVSGEWQYWVSKPHRKKMIATLSMLRAEAIDVVVVNSFACTDGPLFELTKKRKENLFDGAIRQLEKELRSS